MSPDFGSIISQPILRLLSLINQRVIILEKEIIVIINILFISFALMFVSGFCYIIIV